MWARLAQRLEHRICNAMVIGSIPIAGFSLFIFDFLHDWWKYPFLKSNEYSKTFLLFQRLLIFLFSYRNFQLYQTKFFLYNRNIIERVLDISIIHLIFLYNRKGLGFIKPHDFPDRNQAGFPWRRFCSACSIRYR